MIVLSSIAGTVGTVTFCRVAEPESLFNYGF